MERETAHKEERERERGCLGRKRTLMTPRQPSSQLFAINSERGFVHEKIRRNGNREGTAVITE